MGFHISSLGFKLMSLIRKNHTIRMVSRFIRSRGRYRSCYCCICKSSGLHAVHLGGEKLVCIRCGSVGRQRALVSIMNDQFPGWERMSIHESSPSGASFQMFANVCKNYIPTFYWPDVPTGIEKDGFRCEDLQNQTFGNDTFDLVLTQDVFEHIPDPGRAFNEVVRTLKPGGAHIFTVPIAGRIHSVTRTKYIEGEIIHIIEPHYHGNPIDPEGSLVFTDWGTDIMDLIKSATGLETTYHRIRNVCAGIEGRDQTETHSELFITRKPAV